MAEIEEELVKVIPCEKFKIVAVGGISEERDTIEISRLTLSNSEAATLAWLVNQPDGTSIRMELRIGI